MIRSTARRALLCAAAALALGSAAHAQYYPPPSLPLSPNDVVVPCLQGGGYKGCTVGEINAVGGTVTSVGLALPVSVFSVTGSPVTSSGALTGAFQTQSANTVFAGPASGPAATPAFRQLACADLSNASASCSTDATNASNISSGVLAAARGGAGTVSGILQGNGSGTVSAVTVGAGLTFSAGTLSANVTSPGGSSGQVQYNNAGAFGGFTVGGDGTLNTGTGTLTVTKTNGSNFAASATTDTTNASNISSGTLAAARGGAGTVSGALKGNGSGTVSQAACADLSNGGSGGCVATIMSGTFTPAFSGAGTTTWSYATRTGSYLCVNGTVFVHILLIATPTTGGSGPLEVSSLPFVMDNNASSGGYGGSLLRLDGMTGLSGQMAPKQVVTDSAFGIFYNIPNSEVFADVTNLTNAVQVTLNFNANYVTQSGGCS